MRITLDIDGPAWKAWAAFYTHVSLSNKVEIYKTRTGFHVIGYGAPVETPEQVIRVRRWLGDDPVRIDLDEALVKAGKPFQILWTKKNDFQVKLLEVVENRNLD
ncbi:MAG: hypothetical protein DRO36_06865 [Candidatus Hecatellales archaeon]|nr:MAG: hypothetical protein DRO36_06865 [Candidatus Hecatellales archaeon]